MRLLLFSDLHLDTAFGWAGPGLGDRLRAHLRSGLDRIAALAHQTRADALLCGGDLLEQARVTPDTLDHLRATFAALELPVYVAPGEHDWYGPSSPYRSVAWTPNVHVFTESRLRPVELADGITLWGAAHRSPASTDGFLDGFTTGRDGVNLALFHGCEAATAADAVPYAPFHVEQLDAAGLDHALLGHVHTPVDHPRFTYPGNPGPLAPGETGPRAAVLVTVAADGTVARTRYDVAGGRVHEVRVDVTGSRDAADVRERLVAAVADLSGVVRATLHGQLAPAVDLADLADTAARADRPPGGGLDHLDGLVLREGPLGVEADLDALAAERTVRGQFVRDVRTDPALDEDTRRRVLRVGLRALDGRVPETTTVQP
jgi:DNA repair exonuclease SbcCD nuclease subunit